MPSFLSPLARDTSASFELRNQRSGHVLATHVEPAFDSSTRNRGLLGRDELAEGAALALAPCSSVHTWFMRFPIDILFVAKTGVITKVRSHVQPWKLAFGWAAHAVIELPAGGAVDTRAGDTLELVANGRSA